MLNGKEFTGYTPITLERLDKTVNSVTDSLKEIGFFSRTGRPQMEQFWREILSRAALSEGEAKYIEMVFDKAAGLKAAAQNAHNEDSKTLPPLQE